MDLHPNWVGLATVDFQRKIFVKEGDHISNYEHPRKFKYVTRPDLNGEEVKAFYNEVISTPEKPKIKPNVDICTNTIKCNRNVPLIDVQETINDKLIRKYLAAAQENNISDVKRILQICPNILNITDDFGWTALMCAAQSSSIDTLEYLLNENADVNIKEKGGRTVYDLSRKNKYIYNLLINRHGNCINQEITLENRQDNEAYCDVCKESYKVRDRRKHFGSTLHAFNSSKNTKIKTIYGIPESNRGYQLLLRTGWNREKGLGPEGSGHKFPMKTVFKNDRNGFGVKTDIPRVTHKFSLVNKLNNDRYETYRTVNKRYKNKMIEKEKLLEFKLRRELS